MNSRKIILAKNLKLANSRNSRKFLPKISRIFPLAKVSSFKVNPWSWGLQSSISKEHSIWSWIGTDESWQLGGKELQKLFFTLDIAFLIGAITLIRDCTKEAGLHSLSIISSTSDEKHSFTDFSIVRISIPLLFRKEGSNPCFKRSANLVTWGVYGISSWRRNSAYIFSRGVTAKTDAPRCRWSSTWTMILRKWSSDWYLWLESSDLSLTSWLTFLLYRL